MGQGLNSRINAKECIEIDMSRRNMDELDPTLLKADGKITKLYLRQNNLQDLPADIVQLIYLEEISLRNNQIQAIPSVLFQLESLTKLSLSFNRIIEIPKEIGLLKSLKLISFANNLIQYIPDEIGQLTFLVGLDLQRNMLREVPESISGLKSLETLLLNDNHLKRLPEDIGQCKNLRNLNLSKNQLQYVNHSITTLFRLENLNLSKNQLSSLTEDFFDNFEILQSFDAHSNKIKSIPSSVGKCRWLKRANFAINEISQLPDSIFNLRYLEWLNLNDNRLIKLAQEIHQLTNLKKLGLVRNQLTSIPDELGLMTWLQKVDVRDNSINTFPCTVTSLNPNSLVCSVSNSSQIQSAYPLGVPTLRELCYRSLAQKLCLKDLYQIRCKKFQQDNLGFELISHLNQEALQIDICQACLKSMFQFKLVHCQKIEIPYLDNIQTVYQSINLCSYQCLENLNRQSQRKSCRNPDIHDQSSLLSKVKSLKNVLQLSNSFNKSDNSRQLINNERQQILAESQDYYQGAGRFQEEIVDFYAWNKFIQLNMNNNMGKDNNTNMESKDEVLALDEEF